MTLHKLLVAVVTSLLCVTSLTSATGRYDVGRFEPGAVFNHLVWNTETQQLYVGAVNFIYRLDQNLTKVEEVVTGPKMDNPNCPPLGSDIHSKCAVPRADTDAVNKILVIDYSNKRLIACFNLYHGYCEKMHLDNIRQKDEIQLLPIVSNTVNGSSFAFIAPGPTSEMGEVQPEVLYVSASWSTQGLKVYRDEIPAFCSRNLETFRLAFKKFRKSSIEIESQQRDTFPVRYIYGFGSGKFSYMLTVQKKGAQLDNFISKIFRVCQNDPKFYSYAEVELKCMYQNTHYNILQAAYVGKAGKNLAQNLGIPTVEDVLYAIFSLGESNSDTALCIYPLRTIHKKFTENIQQCFEGIGNTGPDHIIAPANCVKANFNITDDYCGEHDINNPIDGTKPIQTYAALRFGSHTNVSAIMVAITHDYTVAFVGTTKGQIIKVTIDSQQEASVYENITVQEGSSVNPDLRMDDNKLHLFVMTEKRLTKLKVQDCQQFKTCGECLGAKDPYCGWCSLENKCSLKEECSQWEVSMRWLPYSGQQCTNITRVIPDQIQKDHSANTHLLKLLIQNLPNFDSAYECAFSYDEHFAVIITLANKTMDGGKATGVTCQTPLPNQLPMVPTGKDHIVMRLSVRMNQQDFVSTDFTIFDCSLHNSCTSCTQSAFPCTWCVKGHICTNQVADDCRRNETLVTGKALPGTSDRQGPTTCPRIEMPLSNAGPQILVADSTSFEVKLRGINLEPYQTRGLKCRFNLNSGETVPATVTTASQPNTHHITCKPVLFRYIQEVSYQNVPFIVLWDDIKALDNPSNIQVTMYKCNVMAGSCGLCLNQDEKYLCGWCVDKESCSTQHTCHRDLGEWLPHQSTCRNPIINSFFPLSGPLAGGTLLTINGQNLGKKQQDLSVTIGQTNCTILIYEAPRKIVCETGDVPVIQSQRVIVRIAKQYQATSMEPFHYVLPHVTDIQPEFGPVSGGTWVTISGQHMDAGTTKQVFIKGKECTFLPEPSTAEYIVCETSPDSTDQDPSADPLAALQINNVPTDRVVVRFDKEQIDVNRRLMFLYVSDPDVTSIHPKQAIRSGGLTITVKGSNLKNVQKPRMVLSFNHEDYDSSCTQESDSKMVCYSPAVDAAFPRLDDPVQVAYGFKMDGVKTLLNLTGLNEEFFGTFMLYPDPEFDKFPNGVESHQKKTEFLTINGRNLHPAIREEDVRVFIGLGACNVTSIAATQLTCRPPKSQPKPKKGNGIPEVEVIVGQNLTFTIGSLKYEEPVGLTLPTIIGIAVGAGVLLFIVIIVIIAYQVKSRRSNDMMKKMRIQMDSLEARVANECKEAFAELQTDMTELTSDLYGQVSIPFWDYRTYCMKVLFPGVENHAVIKELQIGYRRNQEDVERGLQLFFQLISNKTFLLIFIRTLESNKTFQLRDRVNVASLITVALQTKMEYATDILKTLLSDLIEKSVEGKNHPKLLLRRNESVAEKMLTNWFSFLLYKFLKECAGEPLFMLYQAIKQQVSKGPVDSVTSEARYSLSEDKLIRQQINYKSMTLNVLDMDSFTEQKQTHIVKVLDCDTISQVKEKILDAMYKNAPFSSRPAKEDLDLVLFGHPPEWLCHEKSRQLILHDEDNTSKTESDCKRLNTLSHYQVPDGAYVAIVPKQDSLYNSSIISDKSNKFDQMPFNRSPPMNRTVISPQSVTVDFDNNGVKYYHLVRHHDNDPQKEGDRGSKMVTEIYLPRLLVTKGTLQQFVDDLLERIFSTAHRGSALPLAIKYMFDFLDDQALLHNIQEPETVHTWKSNSLPLRFWVNVIKNPNFVFDIYKSAIVDSCLTVVGQTFMDSCSVSEHRLGKDSPSSKLLYAKDIPKYKKWVERYYQDIKMMPAISDQDMTAMLTEESRLHQGEFNTNAALMELYKYVQKYYEEISCALDEDEFARRSKLCFKLEQVQQAMDGDAIC